MYVWFFMCVFEKVLQWDGTQVIHRLHLVVVPSRDVVDLVPCSASIES